MKIKLSIFTLLLLFSMVIAYQLYCSNCDLIEGSTATDEEDNSCAKYLPAIQLPSTVVTPTNTENFEDGESENGNKIQLEVPSIGKVPGALKLQEDNTNEKEKCQPCPPCGRCPEPAFDCKKVPTYSHISHMSTVPEAVVGDYTTYGV